MVFLNHFTNLRVRTKLILFMLVPLITICSLISNNIYYKYSLVSDNDQIFQFITIITQLDSMIYSLQKERGFSSGFVASGGKLFKNELNNQHQKTDKELFRLHTKINNFDPGTSFDDITTELKRSLHLLNQLPKIRKKINLLENSGYISYSEINKAVINLIYHFHHHFQDKLTSLFISHQTETYALLLELQDYADQERALMNDMFSQQQMTQKLFQDISTVLALQQNTITRYMDMSTNKHRRLLEELLTQPFVIEEKSFRNIIFNLNQRNALLNKLHAYIGYGGLIHNFKNYVIRGEPFYYDRFNEQFIDAKEILAEFRQTPGLDEQQLFQIDVIEETFNQYLNFLDTITQLHSDGMSVIAIDRAVKVNDEPALKAVTALRNNRFTIDPNQWWQVATKWVDSLNDFSNEFLVDITKKLQQQKAIIWQEFYLYITLMILVITATLLLGYLLVNRLSKQTTQIASSMHKMRQSGKFDPLAIQRSNDEIGEIVSAFNALNEKRNRAEENSLDSQQQLMEEKKANALYTLSGGVAHNFNNMLATILGYASIAMTHKDVKDSKKVQDYLQCICDNVDKASTLVENIITYSQSNSLIDAEPIQISKVIKDMIEDLQLPSSINQSYHIDANIPSVRIKKDECHKLFNALIQNAIEAIGEKGEIEIALHKTTLNKEQCHACGESINGQFVELSIKDNGIGIDEDIVEHIFDPFFTKKHMSQGTGMGLSTVNGIIRRRGGHILVESTIGQGSKFRVLLPIS